MYQPSPPEAQEAMRQQFNPEMLAEIMVDHVTNEKGEILARVWETAAFQDVYDPKETNLARHNLKRKQEQVFNQYNADSHLFQKVYYNPALLQDDES